MFDRSYNGALIVIQVRERSQRLKNKCFLKLADNKSLLDWVILRMKMCERAHQVVVSTGPFRENRRIADVAESHGLNIFFNKDEDDLVGRFFEIQQVLDPKTMIRVCADNPFVCPAEVDNLINYSLVDRTERDGYLCNHRSLVTCDLLDGFGAESFTKQLIERIYLSELNNSEREHLTLAVSKLINISELHQVGHLFSVPEALKGSVFDINDKYSLNKIRQIINKFDIRIDDTADRIVAKIADRHKGSWGQSML